MRGLFALYMSVDQFLEYRQGIAWSLPYNVILALGSVQNNVSKPSVRARLGQRHVCAALSAYIGQIGLSFSGNPVHCCAWS